MKHLSMQRYILPKKLTHSNRNQEKQLRAPARVTTAKYCGNNWNTNEIQIAIANVYFERVKKFRIVRHRASRGSVVNRNKPKIPTHKKVFILFA